MGKLKQNKTKTKEEEEKENFIHTVLLQFKQLLVILLYDRCYFNA
jgi:hypothetical protein